MQSFGAAFVTFEICTCLEQFQAVYYILFLNWLFGFFFRYEVADLLKMPHNAPELDAILSVLPSDDQWDENNMVEKGYKKANMPRYHLDKIGGILKSRTKEGSVENIRGTTDTVSYKNPELDEEGKPKPSTTLKVKVESEPFHTLSANLKALRSAKTALEKEMNNTSNLMASLEVRDKERIHGDFMDNVGQAMKQLGAFLAGLRTFVAEAEMIRVKDEVPPEILVNAQDMIVAALAHQQGG